MEPRVQYVKTEDGVDIAYCSIGEGPPLIVVNQFPSHVQLEWQLFPDVYGSLSKSFRVIWFDWRGTGLSQRDNLDFSLAARLRDLSAVVDRIGGERLTLAGFALGVTVAVAYASQTPGRVANLILIDGWTSAADVAQLPSFLAEKAIRGQDWTIYTETVARVLSNSGDEALAKGWVAYLRTAVDAEALQAAFVAAETYDVSSLIQKLAMPALVIQNTRNRLLGINSDIGQRLAASLQFGEYLAVDDESYSITVPDAIRAFVQDHGITEPAVAVRPEPSSLRTVLFTDLVGHTEMMQRLGDRRGREVLREHERITREVLKANGGTEVKTMGDGFMASFGSVTKAVECAIALQRAFANREGEPFNVRVGLNAGEPIEEDGDLFGATVILASRIAAKAEGAEILVADTVRGLCSGKGFLFADRGEFVAKGFEEPVRVYEVSWRE